MCTNLEIKTHYYILKNTVVSVSEVHTVVSVSEAKKLGQLDEKTTKNGIFMRHFEKHFSKSKSHALIEAHDQKTKLILLRKN